LHPHCPTRLNSPLRFEISVATPAEVNASAVLYINISMSEEAAFGIDIPLATC
jgi:hypothetical protein